MLGIFRRHQKRCPRRAEGRRYRGCRCPVWVDGHLNGEEIHKSLRTRDWQKAQKIAREWEAENLEVVKPERKEINAAWEAFLADMKGRRLCAATIRKYDLVRRQMDEFAKKRGLRFLVDTNLEEMSLFRAGWSDGPISSAKKLERLRAFFRFAQKRKWTTENPANDLKAPKIPVCPTMPYTSEDMVRILAATQQYADEMPKTGKANARRIRALVLLLRYSGMRIGDAVNLTADRIKEFRLFLYTQKTGVPVNLILPEPVMKALEATPKVNERHFFWSGIGKLESAVRSWQTRLRRLFTIAKIPNGHAHRFRDTFAVELLLSGVPIERVSVLLGHQSVRITERHYSPWVRSRQEQLEADLVRAWSRDPLLNLEEQVTQKLHGKTERVN